MIIEGHTQLVINKDAVKNISGSFFYIEKIESICSSNVERAGFTGSEQLSGKGVSDP